MVSKEQQAKENRIVKGVKEILEFRGYKIGKTNEDDDFLDVYADKTTEDGEKTNVIARFPKNPQIGVKTIRTLGKLQEEEDIDNAMLIAEASLTHYAKKESVKLGIEIISSNNPLFNIFDHQLVPQHVRMKSKDIKAFLEKYQIEKHQIPKILENDPAVKAIQARPGDVIKIVRNPTMGEDGSYYRVVIKSTSRLRLTDSKQKPLIKPKSTEAKTPESKTKPVVRPKITSTKKTESKAKLTATSTKKSKSTTKKTADKKK